MKTVIQELKFLISDGLDNIDESVKVSEIWDKIDELIEKEKQQIIDAYDKGYQHYAPCYRINDAEIYYNETYNETKTSH